MNLGSGMWNEIVVDGRGNAYVNGPSLVLVRPDGSVTTEAEGFAFPNGMAVLPGNHTLVVAESHAKRLTAFDIGEGGCLSNRRVWAELEGPPGGVCADAEGAIWYADVPHSYCRRVVRRAGRFWMRSFSTGAAFPAPLAGPRGKR